VGEGCQPNQQVSDGNISMDPHRRVLPSRRERRFPERRRGGCIDLALQGGNGGAGFCVVHDEWATAKAVRRLRRRSTGGIDNCRTSATSIASTVFNAMITCYLRSR